MKCPACGSTQLEPTTWTQDAVVPAVDGSYPKAGTEGHRCDECGALVPKPAKRPASSQRRPQRAKGRTRKPAAKKPAKPRSTSSRRR